MIKKAEIITIGDEILIGQTIDTNSAYIGERINKLGFEIRQISSISDNSGEIKRALDEALSRADLIIVTGGLGPTKDDITKRTLAEFFGSELKEDITVLEDIKALLWNRKVPMNEMNIAQALVPDKCIVIRNSLGTAPGMLFEKDGKIIISLPGVPYEMKGLMDEKIPALIRERIETPDIIHQMVMTSGFPESYLASVISDWESSLPEFIKLAYLPSPGIVKLRLSASGRSRAVMELALKEEVAKLQKIIPQIIYSYENITLEEALGKLLIEKGLSIATAESCTGGNIASLITSIPGSSEYFKGSVVAYNNSIKRDILGVPQQILNDHGAVSKKVVEIMALNLRHKFNTDMAIAVSGIAGPDGGTEEKPVGTVWIAVADNKGIIAKKYQLGKLRSLNITRASMTALNITWRRLKST